MVINGLEFDNLFSVVSDIQTRITVTGLLDGFTRPLCTSGEMDESLALH